MPELKFLKDTEPYITSYPRTISGGDYQGGRPWDFARPPLGGISDLEVRISTPAIPATEDSWETAEWDSLDVDVEQLAYEGDIEITTSGPATYERGALYWIVQPGGANTAEHLVECAQTGDNLLILKEPLRGDVDTTAKVYGFYARFQLTLAQTALVGEGTAEWRMTISDSVHTWTQAFRIVRTLPYGALTPDALTRAYPVIRNLRPGSDVDLEETIAAAWDHEVLPWLHGVGVREENIVSAETLEPLHAILCVLHLARQRQDVSAEFFDRINTRASQLKDSILDNENWFEISQANELPTPRAKEKNRSNTIRLRR